MRQLTIREMREGFQKKEISPVEVTNYFLKRIEEQKDLNAYITVNTEQAREQAEI
ncbi:MAG TPA: amidase, partial [Bacilli bacterium]|nr:amidase [Bacilli bacterium]